MKRKRRLTCSCVCVCVVVGCRVVLPVPGVWVMVMRRLWPLEASLRYETLALSDAPARRERRGERRAWGVVCFSATMPPRFTTPLPRTVGSKTPGFPGFTLLASERRLREEGERGGREVGGVLGLTPTPSRSTRLDPIENFPINFFPKK